MELNRAYMLTKVHRIISPCKDLICSLWQRSPLSERLTNPVKLTLQNGGNAGSTTIKP